MKSNVTGKGSSAAPSGSRVNPSESGLDEVCRDENGDIIKVLAGTPEVLDDWLRMALESDEPDATGRWDAEHRKVVLRYVYERDDGRCGLCGGEMKLQGAALEHIVPKVFAVFDVRKGEGGMASEGTRWKSRLHRIDNLQAAHTYCNKRKGNTPSVAKWRHPSMKPLVVATDQNSKEFVLPWRKAGTREA